MTDMITWLADNKDSLWTIVTSVVSVAALITAVTPSPKDDSWVASVRKLLDAIALNWGFAKNKK